MEALEEEASQVGPLPVARQALLKRPGSLFKAKAKAKVQWKAKGKAKSKSTPKAKAAPGPVPEGWHLFQKTRGTGKSKGQVDSYWKHSASGVVLRSLPEVHAWEAKSRQE
eukprot:4330984-Alexandrium_andersonii.AAC.1